MSQRRKKREMPNLRKDLISGQWVVIAPRRSERPHLAAQEHTHSRQADEDAICPFCPGNENELLSIITHYSTPGAPGWSVRVVPNKFATFTGTAEIPAPLPEDSEAPTFGFSEVIIESPRHDADLTTMSEDEFFGVMHMYRERFDALIKEKGIAHVTLFRNYGPLSGASLGHPHSQLVATGIYPPRVSLQRNRARDHFAKYSRCIMCDELASELDAGLRIIEKTDTFVALVPYAAQYSSEIWIIPARHQAGFDEITEAEMHDFGHMLRRSLQRLRAVLGDVSYNFVVDTTGHHGRAEPYLHWRLRIAPKLVHWGGFELGTGMAVNPSSPEADAAALRSAGIS
jgi:UDPglucose--hexose-1-phosphate uridylyltransferase